VRLIYCASSFFVARQGQLVKANIPSIKKLTIGIIISIPSQEG